MHKKRVLVLSTSKYPKGDAGALRLHVLSKLFNQMGYGVFVIGMGESTGNKVKVLDNIEYTSLRRINFTKNATFAKILRFFFYVIDFYLLFNRIVGKFHIVFLADTNVFSLLLVKLLARKPIDLIHDSVEWYSPEQFKHWRIAIQYLAKDFYNKKLIRKQIKVIAISKYLERWFISKGNHTIRIPSILDVSKIKYVKNTNSNKLIIIYAGSPGKKDLLKELIIGLSSLESVLLEKVEFRVLGISKKEMIRNGFFYNIHASLYDSVKCYGKIPHDEVLDSYKEADFSVLLRNPNKRYAKAGFPTKVVESLATGTPVITNISSDLGDYLVDGENSIIVNGWTSNDFAAALVKALSLTYAQKKLMYKNARRCAEKHFHYENYLLEFKEFINENK